MRSHPKGKGPEEDQRQPTARSVQDIPAGSTTGRTDRWGYLEMDGRDAGEVVEIMARTHSVLQINAVVPALMNSRVNKYQLEITVCFPNG